MKNAHLKIYLNILPNSVKIDNYPFFSMLFKNKQQNSKKNRILILFRNNLSYQIFGNRQNFWDRGAQKKNFPLFPINLIIINLNLIIFSQIKFFQGQTIITFHSTQYLKKKFSNLVLSVFQDFFKKRKESNSSFKHYQKLS